MELVPATHQHITCNGCNMFPIVGARYQCTHCSEFDYCENCFRTKRSHRYQFNKILDPSESAELFIYCVEEIERQSDIQIDKKLMKDKIVNNCSDEVVRSINEKILKKSMNNEGIEISKK